MLEARKRKRTKKLEAAIRILGPKNEQDKLNKESQDHKNSKDHLHRDKILASNLSQMSLSGNDPNLYKKASSHSFKNEEEEYDYYTRK